MCMFPACCFRQKTYVAQGLVNGVLNKTWTHSRWQFECFSVGFGYGFYIEVILPFSLECVYFSVLYPCLIFDKLKKNTNLFVDLPILEYIYIHFDVNNLRNKGITTFHILTDHQDKISITFYQFVLQLQNEKCS